MMPRRSLFEKLEAKIERWVNWKNITYILYVVSIILAAGIFDVIVHNRPPILSVGSIYPGFEAQTSSEMALVAFSYAVGSIGLFLIYISGKRYSRSRFAQTLLIAGSSACLLALILLMTIYSIKLGG